jgi:hypothetical protein
MIQVCATGAWGASLVEIDLEVELEGLGLDELVLHRLVEFLGRLHGLRGGPEDYPDKKGKQPAHDVTLARTWLTVEAISFVVEPALPGQGN